MTNDGKSTFNVGKLLRSNFSGPIFPHLAAEYEQVYEILENCFKHREGKSAIVVGPRGVGKTHVIENALYTLGREYEYFCVRIKGVFFRDDMRAVKEIARQLDACIKKKKMKENDKGGVSIAESESDKEIVSFEQKSVSATMSAVMNALSEGSGVTSVPVVFIIDQLERYTNGGKQTLLYNLFELAGRDGKCGPVCVLGVSTRSGVREQLEKRVKSRFSQRIVQLGRVKDLTQFIKCVMGDYDGHINESLRKELVQNFYTIRDVRAGRHALALELAAAPSSVLPSYTGRDAEMMEALSPTERRLLACCALCKNRSSATTARTSTSASANASSSSSAQTTLTSSSSTTGTITFDMAHQEYAQQVRRERAAMHAAVGVAGMALTSTGEPSRAALRGAWERLIALGLLGTPSGTSTSTGSGHSVGVGSGDVM